MLAEDLARRGLRTVLIDADRQRGAGILLGISQPDAEVQQTRNPRLRYFCSNTLPLREIPVKARDLAGEFDVAVVDTPSLDDPLARGWIQMSTHALLVIPVEPLSIRTLESADNAVASIQKLNPKIGIVGTLPTMFDETDTTQRTLMLELMSLRSEGLISPAIPYDPGLTHRAEQQSDRRTEASETARLAYEAAGDVIVAAMGLQTAYQAAPSAAYRDRGTAGRPAPAAQSPRGNSSGPAVSGRDTPLGSP